MGQVPESKCKRPYLIVGNGRLSNHFRHYFNLLHIPYWHWWRQCGKPFESFYDVSDRILVLISDGAIEDFIREHRSSGSKIWIHCSGALSTPLADSAHPLMTFTDELYELDTYREIPFICEKGRRSFVELFPELNNPHYVIPSDWKPLYHAWCVMSGNFTTLLWQRFFDVLEDQFGISRQIAYPYLKQISMNLQASQIPLTGPLARNDRATIQKNLESLADEPFRQVYQAFVSAYQSLQHSSSEGQ